MRRDGFLSVCWSGLYLLTPAVCLSCPFYIRTLTSAGIVVGEAELFLSCSDGKAAGLTGWEGQLHGSGARWGTQHWGWQPEWKKELLEVATVGTFQVGLKRV